MSFTDLFLEGYQLKTPYLLFKGDSTALTPYYGLSVYGSYELPPKPPKSILILYPDSQHFKDIAEKIVKNLDNGFYKYFPRGFREIFEVDVDFDIIPVEYNKYHLDRPSTTTEAFYGKFIETCGDTRKCFPIIFINKVPRGLYESSYINIKYRFTMEGIPTQVITYESFSDEKIYKWSIFPLALQIFVKMGGVPFLLHEHLSIPVNETAIIMGFGLTRIHLPDREVKYVGFALAFEINGRWRLIKWSPSPYSRDNLPQMLKKLLVDVLDKVIGEYAVNQPEKIHLIIHYSGKNVRVSEEDAIKSACLEIEKIHNITVIPYIVKIQPSMFRIYEEANECPDVMGRPTFLVNVGTVIKLKEDLYLLHTTGCVNVQTRSGEVISKPNAHGAPSPLIVSIKRLEGINYELEDKELIKSVFYMCRMNYAAINNPVSKIPITVKYSKLLAYLTLKLALKQSRNNIQDINLLVPQELKQKLWFI